MSAADKLSELSFKRDAVYKATSTARHNIEGILDNGSFVELGAFVTQRFTEFNLPTEDMPGDGVIAGFGTIDGRLVYIYSQDVAIMNGSIGEMGAGKIAKVYEQALKMGAPVIGVLDSNGVRLSEGLDSVEGYGEIFKYQSAASGVIPQLTLILGKCLGINSFIPAMSDFVIMEENKSVMFVNSPNTVCESGIMSFKEAGNAKINSERGLAHFVCEDEQGCFNALRELCSFLPSNNLEDAPLNGIMDDLNREETVLNAISALDKPEDVRTIITLLSDKGCFLEVKKNYGASIVTGFVRFNGYTAGIVANQGMNDDGRIDIKGCDKAIEFVNMCDAFNIPIITLTDTVGYKASMAEENAGLSRNIAKLMQTFANATVPKIDVIIRQAFGSAYMVMNSKHIGADLVYAWPKAQISLMQTDAAVDIMYADKLINQNRKELIEEYEEKQASSYIAAKRGYIDDIIEPSQTRKYLIIALEMLESKRESKPAKKHVSR